MLSLPTLALFAFTAKFISHADAAGKTHIYIDQIPLYTELASCAQDPLGAIIRNQASGCGDDTQLTSFACFCLYSSSEFSSIISTAVEQQCSQSATQPVATRIVGRRTFQTTAAAIEREVVVRQATAMPTGAAKDLSSALEVWDSYCAKSTELDRFGPNSTDTPATVVITQAPETVVVTPASRPGTRNVPIAAIVVPTVIVPLVFLLGALLYVRRSKKKHERRHASMAENQSAGQEKDAATHAELVSEDVKPELLDSNFAHELEDQLHRVEVDCNPVVIRQEGMSRVEM